MLSLPPGSHQRPPAQAAAGHTATFALPSRWARPHHTRLPIPSSLAAQGGYQPLGLIREMSFGGSQPGPSSQPLTTQNPLP